VDGDLVRRVNIVFSSMRRIAAVASLVTAAGLPTMVAAASAAGASRPQRRQLAITTLSDFKAVLTATHEAGHPLPATVTAAGVPADRQRLAADRHQADRQGQRVVLVLGGNLLTDHHAAQEQYVSVGGDVRLDQGQPADHALGCSGTFSKRWTP